MSAPRVGRPSARPNLDFVNPGNAAPRPVLTASYTLRDLFLVATKQYKHRVAPILLPMAKDIRLELWARLNSFARISTQIERVRAMRVLLHFFTGQDYPMSAKSIHSIEAALNGKRSKPTTSSPLGAAIRAGHAEEAAQMVIDEIDQCPHNGRRKCAKTTICSRIFESLDESGKEKVAGKWFLSKVRRNFTPQLAAKIRNKLFLSYVQMNALRAMLPIIWDGGEEALREAEKEIDNELVNTKVSETELFDHKTLTNETIVVCAYSEPAQVITQYAELLTILGLADERKLATLKISLDGWRKTYASNLVLITVSFPLCDRPHSEAATFTMGYANKAEKAVVSDALVQECVVPLISKIRTQGIGEIRGADVKIYFGGDQKAQCHLVGVDQHSTSVYFCYMCESTRDERKTPTQSAGNPRTIENIRAAATYVLEGNPSKKVQDVRRGSAQGTLQCECVSEKLVFQ